MDRDERRSQGTETNSNTLVAERGPRTGEPAFDPDKYREHIEEFDLTEEQANELLRTLWEIMSAFVDLGFGLHPVQEVLKTWGQLDTDVRKYPGAGPGEVDYRDQSITGEFAGPADPKADPAAGRDKT